MNDIYLLNYSVKGIKNIDQRVTLSFYKKIISKPFNKKGYNIKAIYGENGSGKSGIITSVKILKHVLLDSGYLSNPYVQSTLNELVNKRTQSLDIESDFLVRFLTIQIVYRYSISITRASSGRFEIASEHLSILKSSGLVQRDRKVFEVELGELKETNIEAVYQRKFADLSKKFINLLSFSSLTSLLFDRGEEFILGEKSFFSLGIISLILFGIKLHIHLDDADDHKTYFLQKTFGANLDDFVNNIWELHASDDEVLDEFYSRDVDHLDTLDVVNNIVDKKSIKEFERTVSGLYEFLHIFKYSLKGIEVDRKEDRDSYICNLIMVYDDYKVQAEFESTGVKKLVKLYAYLKEMVSGDIVFIDEFDSNLHDVYLCALLEYLMDYGRGQLCFTTHNVGPMDVLRHNNKSIDFLSSDHKIYEWRKNGNYSPSKLYRKGMIEGSPFNIDEIDFIHAFGIDEGE